MVLASTALKNVYRNDHTVKVGSKLIIESNMNSMIDGITVTSKDNSSEYTAPIYATVYSKDENDVVTSERVAWPNGRPSPFKKLFPLDSIVKPFRPEIGGVKYFVNPIPDEIETNGATEKVWVETLPYSKPRSQTYDYADPRYYYPGAATVYKYWVAPVGKDVDLTVRYKQTEATWKAAKNNGDVPSTSGDIPLGNKSALVNKIYVNFDLWNLSPESCSIIVEKADGTLMPEVSGEITSVYSGVVEFYYNGTTWTTEEPNTYADPILINAINVKAVNPTPDLPGLRIAVIEVSGRYIKNISQEAIEWIDVTKETSAGTNDLLPVGFVNSNLLTTRLSDFNKDILTFKDYNRYITSFAKADGTLNNNVIYLSKNSKVKYYIKTFHEDGELGTEGSKYDETLQGIFYIDTYAIDEFGSVDISCLDGSKQMMDTLCPDLMLKSYPVTAILRVLLDNIGFTNYNFNTKPTPVEVDGQIEYSGPDQSIPTINYWWTLENETVWEAIQNLCRDIQMNAFFDEEGILQFYSRDYLYSQTTASWTFRYDEYDYIDNSNSAAPVARKRLPNIVTFNKKEIASANQVKVLWSTPASSNYLGNSTYLWQSPQTYLAAGGLRQSLPNPTAKITGAVANGTRVVYTAANTYTVGQVVNITGLNPSQFNLSNAKITAVTDSTFTVNSTITGTFLSGGSTAPSATITNAVYSNGFTTYVANNSFAKGEKVSIAPSGIKPMVYGLPTPVPIVEATSTSFKVASRVHTSPYTSGGVANGQSYGLATVTNESTALFLNINSIDTYQTFQSVFNFNGYFLIDSEIIEFDAIQYMYNPLLRDDGSPNEPAAGQPMLQKYIWIETATDLSKYKAMSKNGPIDENNPAETTYFKPTGSYRIKARGALGTTPAFHNATTDKPAAAWTSKQVTWTSK